ncbi:MAG: cation:proton antiporter [Pseudomonadota bacterium]
MTSAQLSVLFFVQIFVILAASFSFGWAGKKFFNQPIVVGEMIAGVLLGPTLFGWLAPEWQQALFPKESISVLYVVAQLGIGLFMFIVGMDFRIDHFKNNAGTAAAVSISGMVAPFIVAILITPWLMSVPGLFTATTSTFNATLFMGAAIAITAFPVLARIIHERGLNNSRLGALTLSAGAVDDAGAWCVLAIVLGSLGGDPSLAIKTIGGGLLFASVLIVFGPRILAPLGRMVERDGKISRPVLSLTLMALMICAFVADGIGLHAVFGGFLLGTVMPRGKFVEEIKKQVEPLALVLLIPIFFTFSGLNTHMTMINNPELIGIAAVVLVGSILAKGGACWAAARLCGQDNRTAMGIGALMNARGLMELIIINIGLQRGIIGPALFSMLVLMTIVTTLMATPVFEWTYGKHARKTGELGELEDEPVGDAPISTKALAKHS